MIGVHPGQPESDRLSWTWESGQSTTLSQFGNPEHDTDYALCVYDGAATGQTELAAPAPGTDSLILGLGLPAGTRYWVANAPGEGFTYQNSNGGGNGIDFARLEAGEDGEASMEMTGVGRQLGLDTLVGIDGDQVISQVQNSEGECFGAAVSVDYGNGPQFPVSTKVLDESAARPMLNELASQYNRNNGGEPLNMTLWISALAATAIQNLVVTTDPADLDTTALFSTLHVAGWYGGMWFARDGFQSAAPAAANADGLDAVEMLYDAGRISALEFTDAQIFDYLTNEEPSLGSFDQGTGLRSLVSSYGYNTGYALTVIEDTADGAIIPPPANKLDCEGSHPPLVSPPFTPGDGPLFGCTYAPSFLNALDDLRPMRDDYLAAFPDKAEELRQFQGDEEVRGRQVWTSFLTDQIIVDQAVREALWDVDNAFLEVIHGAALLNMGAQARGDARLGRQAALASSSVLKGWLESYFFGLGAPEPRLLPRFDLGTTPIQAH